MSIKWLGLFTAFVALSIRPVQASCPTGKVPLFSRPCAGQGTGTIKYPTEQQCKNFLAFLAKGHHEYGDRMIKGYVTFDQDPAKDRSFFDWARASILHSSDK